jgi:type VI protein secretion system component VasF
MSARGRAWRGRFAVAALLALLAFAGCGDLSRDELNRGVESLSALAAQGELIANGVARDATKSTYTRVMAKTLGGEAEHEAEKLADAEPSAEVKEERNAAVQIAGELADLFSELQTFPSDEHHGSLVEKHMADVKEQADAVVERLSGEEA